MSNRTLFSIVTVIIVGLVMGIGLVVSRSVDDASSREYKITIPEGTGDLIATGQNPDIIPDEIHLTLGEKDILVIQNNDVVGHNVAGFWVGAGEIFRQKFLRAAEYQGECTLHTSAQVRIIVSE